MLAKEQDPFFLNIILEREERQSYLNKFKECLNLALNPFTKSLLFDIPEKDDLKISKPNPCKLKSCDSLESSSKISTQPMTFQNSQERTYPINPNNPSLILQEYLVQIRLLIINNYIIETKALFDTGADQSYILENLIPNQFLENLRMTNHPKLVIKFKFPNIQNKFSDTFFLPNI